MARKARRRKKRKSSRKKGHVPLRILERRLSRLNNIVKSRGGRAIKSVARKTRRKRRRK